MSLRASKCFGKPSSAEESEPPSSLYRRERESREQVITRPCLTWNHRPKRIDRDQYSLTSLDWRRVRVVWSGCNGVGRFGSRAIFDCATKRRGREESSQFSMMLRLDSEKMNGSNETIWRRKKYETNIENMEGHLYLLKWWLVSEEKKSHGFLFLWRAEVTVIWIDVLSEHFSLFEKCWAF